MCIPSNFILPIIRPILPKSSYKHSDTRSYRSIRWISQWSWAPLWRYQWCSFSLHLALMTSSVIYTPVLRGRYRIRNEIRPWAWDEYSSSPGDTSKSISRGFIYLCWLQLTLLCTPHSFNVQSNIKWGCKFLRCHGRLNACVAVTNVNPSCHPLHQCEWEMPGQYRSKSFCGSVFTEIQVSLGVRLITSGPAYFRQTHSDLDDRHAIFAVHRIIIQSLLLYFLMDVCLVSLLW